MQLWGKRSRSTIAAEVIAAAILWLALAALVAPQIEWPNPRERMRRAMREMRVMGTGLGSYQVDYNGYPTSKAAEAPAAPTGRDLKDIDDLANDGTDAALARLVGGAAAPAPARWEPRIPADADAGTADDEAAVRVARAFLDEREEVEQVATLPARGYFRNSYVPSDATTRWLAARLAGESTGSQPLRLHALSHRAAMPFDAPEGAALALFLAADRRSVRSRSRLCLQVGLQGTTRRAGRRSAMNVALVLDLRHGVKPEDRRALEELALVLARARDVGDRFFLVAAGKEGGLLVPPDDYKHGAVSIALGRGATSAPSAIEADLPEALDMAAHLLGNEAATGESRGLLILASSLPLSDGSLPDLAHGYALRGLCVSVATAGAATASKDADRIALAGHGLHHVISTPAAADRIVAAELHAQSRLVAKAIRVSIRLAPGVSLVEVLGSQPLAAKEAASATAGEKNLEERLARDLGIAAERREEDGIQILIPSFLADDRHAILLDLLVPGPGPVADVTVAYSDLVFVRSGLARAHLSLFADDEPSGPLQVAVLKELVAIRFGEIYERAAEGVKKGHPDEAERLLRYAASLSAGLPIEVTGLRGDPDLLDDLAMAEEYLRGLKQPALAAQLAPSLSYAARLKVLPAPASMEGTRS